MLILISSDFCTTCGFVVDYRPAVDSGKVWARPSRWNAL